MRLTIVSTPSVQDSDGNWTPGISSIVNRDCRAEPNQTNGFVVAQDGSRIDYSWIVYLPLSADTYQVGTNVEIFNGAELIASDSIKRFSRGQLSMRIWL